ncbi:hypothetical protein, partial [Anaerotruncus colihominis]|uniref:hypothetical protein n=1 Tax=Anaerotruncus colihominis TaxID=169435 RepID=UPI00174A6453
DFVLALIFLLVCAVVVWPLVSHWLKTAEIPDSPVFVNEDGTPYEYGTSTEWFDIASHIEFHDPFEWFDMASGIEFHDPFDPESWTDIVPLRFYRRRTSSKKVEGQAMPFNLFPILWRLLLLKINELLNFHYFFRNFTCNSPIIWKIRVRA